MNESEMEFKSFPMIITEYEGRPDPLPLSIGLVAARELELDPNKIRIISIVEEDGGVYDSLIHEYKEMDGGAVERVIRPPKEEKTDSGYLALLATIMKYLRDDSNMLTILILDKNAEGADAIKEIASVMPYDEFVKTASLS